ncbi:carboxylate--amine ligase (plasmid) [Halorussus limi]|uniref:Carboxylate--amine ligase n=1 Tax=Halorussus limi TaxID=2938695 RepID=A0A8U0I196_9EURY|nr:carboxylate--amine ligase [Halorussus limi]UPV76661.1 carboxylate--amine ligase [Halorussus limi]
MSAKGGAGDGVVVPAITHPSSLACARSLGRRGFKTILVSEDESAEAFRSRYCDESVVVPSPSRDATAYKEALLGLARRSDVRTVLPVREKDVYLLSKYRDEFADHVGTPWPEFETLRTVQDRIRLYDAARKVGVPSPETHLLTECSDWSRPWIMKGRYSVLPTDSGAHGAGESRGLARPPTTRYLPAGERPDADRAVADMHHVPIVQEYLRSTDEYGFFALYDEGEAVATFQHRQIRGVHYSGGASAFRRSVEIPELERLGTRLLDHLDWHGVAMVEFLRDPDTGDFELMEINPRFWSSLPFTVQAGADFPYYAWLLANGDRDRIECDYEVGTAGHLLSGEASHLLSILADDTALVERPSFARTAADVLTSLVRHPRFDYLDPTDPLPFARYASNRIAGLSDRLVGSADEDDPASVPTEPPQRSRLEVNEPDFE